MNKSNLSDEARTLALQIWQEQLDCGLGSPGETVTDDLLDEWLANRVYPAETLEAAARGDVAALVLVRQEAGLPIFR
ncbi:MAG: hypothetical protein ACOYYF_07605 [Chloroflexota bacterium]|nr:hypothetical protein [Chloroflexota bacterium]MBI5704197.1 hypothetical protein [Chloroflexota bacterium]